VSLISRERDRPVRCTVDSLMHGTLHAWCHCAVMWIWETCAAHTEDRSYKVKTVGLKWNVGNSMHYVTVQSCGSGKHEQHILRTERRVKIAGLKWNKKSLVSAAFIAHWCSMICFTVTASIFDATVSQIRSWVSVLLQWLPLSSHHPVMNPLFYRCSVSDSKYRYSQDIDLWLESEVGFFAKISALF